MMNRKIILFFLAVICIGKAQSQTHRDSLKAMYDSLPSHYYPSKILHNRSPLHIL